MSQRAVIDRIVDGRHAVLLVGDEQTEHVVPVDRLPAGASEGDWLRVRLRGARLIDAQLDPEATAAARARVEKKLEQLRKRGRNRKRDG